MGKHKNLKDFDESKTESELLQNDRSCAVFLICSFQQLPTVVQGRTAD